MASKHKALIVGGGFGGVKAALDLQSDPRFKVTLLSDHDDFRYYPTLYRTATGASRNASSLPLSEIFAETDIEILIDSAKSIDHEGRQLKTKSGKEIEYDVVVLALGMVTNYFGIPGIEKLYYGIKTIEEAEELKKHLHKHIVKKKHPDLNYVIVGGGPTGVELAGVLGEYIELICKSHNISKRTIHVDLIEAAPRVLPTMPKSISRKVARQLRKRGVKLYLNKAVSSQSAEELIVNDKPIRSHTVIWTAGTANNPFYSDQDFQLATNHKVRVDQFLQTKPGLYVIGDNADTPYSGLAQTALYDGQYVASNIKRLADKEKPLPYKAKLPIYVLPAGPSWAAVLWGNLKFYGLFGWVLRKSADLIAFHDYEPWFKATRHWLAESKPEELCEHCDKS